MKNVARDPKSMANKPDLAPFLKWPGGKRWFVHSYANVLPANFNRYIEPFLGSGSVFFHLKPRRAILGDTNPDLVSTYEGIKQDWKGLVRSLSAHQRRHSDTYFYEVRSCSPRTLVQRAARMIYLNRTCFNGIYRINKRGEFNVPRGDRNEVVRTSDDFEAISKLLSNAELRHADFEAVINCAKTGDLVFADPPYTVRHNNNGFLRYNEELFSWNDQERLAASLARAKGRKVRIICTNADHRSIRELYRDYGFQLTTVKRYSAISAATGSRRQFSELLITVNI